MALNHPSVWGILLSLCVAYGYVHPELLQRPITRDDEASFQTSYEPDTETQEFDIWNHLDLFGNTKGILDTMYNISHWAEKEETIYSVAKETFVGLQAESRILKE